MSRIPESGLGVCHPSATLRENLLLPREIIMRFAAQNPNRGQIFIRHLVQGRDFGGRVNDFALLSVLFFASPSQQPSRGAALALHSFTSRPRIERIPKPWRSARATASASKWGGMLSLTNLHSRQLEPKLLARLHSPAIGLDILPENRNALNAHGNRRRRPCSLRPVRR